MKKAFSYMFFDNKFIAKSSKLFIYVLLMLFCSVFAIKNSNGKIGLDLVNYIAIFILSLFIFFTIEGYRIANIKVINESSEKSVFPNFNLKKNFFLGLKYQIAFLMFFIPFSAIIGAFAFSFGVALGIAMPTWLIYTSGILTGLSILLFTIYITCFLPASILIFTKKNSIWSFYKFEEIFKITTLNKEKYICSVLLYCFITFLVGMIEHFSLKFAGMPLPLFLIILALLAIFWVYLFFVSIYIVADLDRETL